MEIRINPNDAAKGLRVELKYCERCGALWLRAVGVAQVYCAGCGREMGELPVVAYESGGSEREKERRRLQWILENSGAENLDDHEHTNRDGAKGVA